MTKKVNKHLLLCATPTKQKCFKGNEGQKTWEFLKKTLKKLSEELKLCVGLCHVRSDFKKLIITKN